MKELKDKFMTQAKFSAAVEEVVKNSDGLVNYIDAVIVVCDDLDIEVETVNKLLQKRYILGDIDTGEMEKIKNKAIKKVK